MSTKKNTYARIPLGQNVIEMEEQGAWRVVDMVLQSKRKRAGGLGRHTPIQPDAPRWPKLDCTRGTSAAERIVQA